MPAGRPATYEKPEDLKLAWDLFKKENQNEYINKTSFRLWAGISRGCLRNYAEKEEFKPILENMEDDSKMCLIKKSLDGEYNSNIAKLILSADYGMAEKTEQKLKAEIDVKDFRNKLINEIENNERQADE